MTMKRAIIISICILLCAGFVTFVAIKTKTAKADSKPIVISDPNDLVEMSDIQIQGAKIDEQLAALQQRYAVLRHKYAVPDEYVNDQKGQAVIGWKPKPADKKQ